MNGVVESVAALDIAKDCDLQDKSSIMTNNNDIKMSSLEESPSGQAVSLAKVLKELQELKIGMSELRCEVAWIRSHLEKQQNQRRMSVCQEDSLESEPDTPSRSLLRRGSTMLVKEVEMEHKDLIDKLRDEGIILNDKVYNVMLSVNFRNFHVEPSKRYCRVLIEYLNSN